jgi:hypothetical protein
MGCKGGTSATTGKKSATLVAVHDGIEYKKRTFGSRRALLVCHMPPGYVGVDAVADVETARRGIEWQQKIYPNHVVLALPAEPKGTTP